MLFFGFMSCFCAVSVVPLAWHYIQYLCRPFALRIGLHVRRPLFTLALESLSVPLVIYIATSSVTPVALQVP